MLGVFMALDFFLFYVFWEVMLLPMYFLIGVWGGPRREYAAIKFFLFTLVGSVLMLIAILMLYFASDLNQLTPINWPTCRMDRRHAGDHGLGRRTRSTFWRWPRSANCADSPFDPTLLWGQSLDWWAFLLLFIGFRDQAAGGAGPHLAARRPRRGADADLDDPGRRAAEDGRLRHPPHLLSDLSRRAATTWPGWSAALGVVSMVYGAFAAMAQKDFKRLVAYSSVSHMGYVLLGIGVWSAVAGNRLQRRLLDDGHERGHVPDDRPRHQLGRHVLPGRRDLRPRPSSQPGPVRRTVRAGCRSTAASRS